MMSKNSINRVILVGHVGQDPELKFTTSGNSVTTFSLATNEVWADAENNKKEHTEWHNVVVWNKLADFATDYLDKGQLVYIEGKLQTRSYNDKDGIKDIVLYYRFNSNESYKNITMDYEASYFAIIPGFEVISNQIEYYFLGTDIF